MSRETIEWLNENVLVGFTGQRGHAWHYRQGSNNHYDGAIPVSDVESRLFSWEPEVNLLVCPCGCGDVFKSVSRSDNRHRMGMFKESYEPHSYRAWLLRTTSAILGDTLQIGSAGLLRKGAVAWVSFEVPNTITTPEGVAFRPHLLATTSFDGSIATTWKRVVTFTVCDNTRAAALAEKGQEFRVKHTKYSEYKLTDARSALAIVHSVEEEVMSEVAELCATTVTDRQWFQFLDEYAPKAGEGESIRTRNAAEKKRDGLTAMWRHDPRASVWKGTAFGVLQSVDTWLQHESIVRGATRPERNMMNVITGKTEQADRDALKALSLVLA